MLAWVEFTMKDAFNPFRKFFTWMLPTRQRAFQAARNIHKFALEVIENYRRNPNPPTQTVIDMIMKNPNYASDMERASDIIVVLFAGHDTTGYTLAIALQQLAMHPEEQKRLRLELYKGNQASQRESPYLRAVVSETMRMYPVVNLPGIKSLGRDFVTNCGNYFIPKGSIALIAQLAIARDETLFEKPFEFRPSRWLNTSEDMKRSLFPFSLGNRNCIGQPLANSELFTILPYLIQNFEFSIVDAGIISVPGATLRLDNCRLNALKI